MANSKYGYVRSFEQPDSLLANTWMVVRIDGRGFSKLTAKYKFVKPNDRDALDLMNAAAEAVMKELPDLVLAYGNSDEFSFVFHKDCTLFERRASKLTTTIVSTFTSYYVFLWSKYFPEKPLTPPLPSFDGRAVCYPSDLNLRDYMSWRQVDCHINNLYNTTFWTLVQQGGMGAREAEERLSGTVSKDKNEILFKEFGINYNNEPECFRKGTIMYRDFFPTPAAEISGPLKTHKSSRAPKRDETADVPKPTEAASTSKPAQAAENPSMMARPHPVKVGQRRPSEPVSEVSPVLPTLPAFPSLSAVPARTNQQPNQTFLSPASTPSPPPSPPKSQPKALDERYPNPLRSNPVSPRTSQYPNNQPSNHYPPNSMPLSPPVTATSPRGKHPFSSLTPLPLSPVTLKPSSKPPMSLNAPNPTTRTNFSPAAPPKDFTSAFFSDSASTSTSTFRPLHSHSQSVSASFHSPHTAYGSLRRRSPSLSQLPTYPSHVQANNGPPLIPLRISSIPADSKPRKLSLQNLRTKLSLQNMSASANAQQASPARSTSTSPPLNTNKDLPSPPTGEPLGPHRRIVSDPDRGSVYEHPGIAELPATRPWYPRMSSCPPTSSGAASMHMPVASTPGSVAGPVEWPIFPLLQEKLQSSIPGSSGTQRAAATPSPPPAVRETRAAAAAAAAAAGPAGKSEAPPSSAPRKDQAPSEQRPKERSSKDKPRDRPAKSQDARSAVPAQMSRTQREKDRKKRSKARVLVEHVDLIKDDFWEARPWILSGTTG